MLYSSATPAMEDRTLSDATICLAVAHVAKARAGLDVLPIVSPFTPFSRKHLARDRTIYFVLCMSRLLSLATAAPTKRILLRRPNFPRPSSILVNEQFLASLAQRSNKLGLCSHRWFPSHNTSYRSVSHQLNTMRSSTFQFLYREWRGYTWPCPLSS
jgi:hypothetical protein